MFRNQLHMALQSGNCSPVFSGNYIVLIEKLLKYEKQ